jgi:hypothetical protein
MPKLSVNLVSKGKYFRVGEEIPAEELPAFALKYVVSEDETAKPQVIHQRTNKLYLHPRHGFVLAADKDLISGEPILSQTPVWWFRADRQARSKMKRQPMMRKREWEQKLRHQSRIEKLKASCLVIKNGS